MGSIPTFPTISTDVRMSDTIYTHIWTPKEGRALLRRLQAYLKKERERKRRWRAKQKKKKAKARSR